MTMGKRVVAAIALVVCLQAPAFAQVPTSQNIAVPLNTATCNSDFSGGGCVGLLLTGQAGVAIQVQGTYSGTISFEGSVDGSTYVALNMTPLASTTAVSSTTSTGVWTAGVGGLVIVRARMSAYTSGTANVSIRSALVSARGGSGGGATVPGSDTQVIFNDGGAFGADTQFLYNKSTGRVTAKLLTLTDGSRSIDFTVGDGATRIKTTGSSGVGLIFRDFNDADRFHIGSTAGGFGGCSGWNIQGTNNTVPGDFGPCADNTYNLGASNSRVKMVYSAGYSGTNLLWSNTAPTISSGFGTSPSVTVNNGTAAFVVNVGTGGTASSGVIGLPTAANGWNCWVTNITSNAANRAGQWTVQTASSTTTCTVQHQTISTGAALAWAASDLLRVSAFAY